MHHEYIYPTFAVQPEADITNILLVIFIIRI